jgi:HK97 family phage prohead protease
VYVKGAIEPSEKDRLKMDCSTGVCIKVDDSEDNRIVKVVISTKDVDRDGDVVEPKGADLTNYRKNPVVLFNHDYEHPVARCSDIQIKNDRIEATVKFPNASVSKKSDEVYGLIKEGVLNATSIGFSVKSYDYLYEEPGNAKTRITGLHIKEWELREFSIVSVPANPGALVIERMAKSDESVPVELDEKEPDEHVVIPVERMKRQIEILDLQSPEDN